MVAVFVPHAFVAVSFTVYVPAAEYECVGFCNVLVPLSPKFHDHEMGDPVDVSVKVTSCPAGTVVGVPVKFATGVAQPMVFVTGLEDPQEFVAIRVTVYVPAVVYVCVGFCNVLVPPSPKFHDQEVGDPVDVSVKVTACPAGALAGAVKFATGTAQIVIDFVAGLEDPQVFVAVSVTV